MTAKMLFNRKSQYCKPSALRTNLAYLQYRYRISDPVLIIYLHEVDAVLNNSKGQDERGDELIKVNML